MRWFRGSLFVVGALVVGCRGQLEAPPIEVAYRESLMGMGKIIQVANTGTEALSGCSARIENPDGDVKNYTLGVLNGGETIEVGWKKLDGFQVDDQAEIDLSCEGFGLPVRAALAPSDEAS